MPTKQHLRTPPEVIRKNRNRMRVHLNSNLQSNLTFLGLLHHIYTYMIGIKYLTIKRIEVSFP